MLCAIISRSAAATVSPSSSAAQRQWPSIIAEAALRTGRATTENRDTPTKLQSEHQYYAHMCACVCGWMHDCTYVTMCASVHVCMYTYVCMYNVYIRLSLCIIIMCVHVCRNVYVLYTNCTCMPGWNDIDFDPNSRA